VTASPPSNPGALRPATEADPPPKLPVGAHFVCGWPLVLILIGGAIGGGLGGAAYGINIAIYKSNLPLALKFLFNLLVGLTAIGIWLAIAMAISSRR
jgi:hypothetical protein